MKDFVFIEFNKVPKGALKRSTQTPVGCIVDEMKSLSAALYKRFVPSVVLRRAEKFLNNDVLAVWQQFTRRVSRI